MDCLGSLQVTKSRELENLLKENNISDKRLEDSDDTKLFHTSLAFDITKSVILPSKSLSFGKTDHKSWKREQIY